MKNVIKNLFVGCSLFLMFSCNDDDDNITNSQLQTISEIASGNPNLSVLVEALNKTGLTATFNNPGSYTVFAPTNDAFAKLPAGTLDDLLKPENKDKLADILQYHVSIGVYKEDMLQDGQTLGQANSGNITISKKDGKITVNGTANVIGSVPASNGIIYIIDGVLTPADKK